MVLWTSRWWWWIPVLVVLLPCGWALCLRILKKGHLWCWLAREPKKAQRDEACQYRVFVGASWENRTKNGWLTNSQKSSRRDKNTRGLFVQRVKKMKREWSLLHPQDRDRINLQQPIHFDGWRCWHRRVRVRVRLWPTPLRAIRISVLLVLISRESGICVSNAWDHNNARKCKLLPLLL